MNGFSAVLKSFTWGTVSSALEPAACRAALGLRLHASESISPLPSSYQPTNAAARRRFPLDCSKIERTPACTRSPRRAELQRHRSYRSRMSRQAHGFRAGPSDPLLFVKLCTLNGACSDSPGQSYPAQGIAAQDALSWQCRLRFLPPRGSSQSLCGSFDSRSGGRTPSPY